MDAEHARRLAHLEREMEFLRAEFARLREHVGASGMPPRLADAPAAPPPLPPAPPAFPDALKAASPVRKPVLRVDTPPPSRSFEELIGRYATVAVGTITVLVGVGIFLNWAIEHAVLGPTMRVVLGYFIAVVVAGVGARLRLRGTREFGNVLLAMALGVVHLVSWSAGPLLHVIPSWAALAIGFIASAVLAEFALRHDEEILCAIGFGGAAVAPFVTADANGNRIALAAYGMAVVALAAAALSDRAWRVARYVAMASVILYTVASGTGLPSSSPPEWISTRLWVLFPLAALVALIPFTRAPHRRSLIRTAAAGLILGGSVRAVIRGPDLWAMGLTVLGALVTISVLDMTRPGALDSETGHSRGLNSPFEGDATVLDAFFLPLGLFLTTAMSTPGMVSFQSAALAALWTLGTLWMTHRTRAEPEADSYASAASLTALWIVPAAFFHHELARVAGSMALGPLLMIAALRMNRQPFVAGALAALTLASVWALQSINSLPRYQYIPFVTVQTVGCALAVIGWMVSLRIQRRREFLPDLDPGLRDVLRRGLVVGGAIMAFCWGVGELRGAWNPSASTSGLIVYYAATGTLMIWLGRSKDVKPLRLIGLGLSLWAALKSLVQAFSIPNVAVRISVFFVVSAFLIAVGYWYRRGAGDDSEAATPAAT